MYCIATTTKNVNVNVNDGVYEASADRSGSKTRELNLRDGSKCDDAMHTCGDDVMRSSIGKGDAMVFKIHSSCMPCIVS